MSSSSPPKKKYWSWRSQAFRGLAYQLLAVLAIVGVGWFLVHNTLVNMRMRGIQSGFDFLIQPAGFDIGESLFAFSSEQPYWRAILVGVSNTLRVAIIGIVLSSAIGTVIGIGRFSRNILVRGLSRVYVEMFRNIPVLIQLLLWYVVLTEVLPVSSEAITLSGMFLSKGGLSYPVPVWSFGYYLAGAGVLVGLVAAGFYRHWARRSFEATGQVRSLFWMSVVMVLLGGLAGWLVGGVPTELDRPFKGDFSIENGAALTPEFLAVLIGLVLYTSAFIAEVVRGGIQSVSRGQSEAASALGLNRIQEMRLVMLPQAMRVIIPPVTNQYLNLTKNSSLAVAIGYPDVVSVANTALNQTGRAVECISIVMLVYLTTSLGTSLLMNWYNSRAAIKER